MKNRKGITAIILAAGKSTRMGKNKLLLPFKGKPILERIIDTVNQCSFTDIVLVSGNSSVTVLAIKKGLKVEPNDFPEKGQSLSVCLGVKAALKGDGFMFFMGDQPNITQKSISSLCNRFYNENANKIIVPVYKGKRGAPVIFPSSYYNKLCNLQGDVGGRSIISSDEKQVRFHLIENSEEGIDIDTREDYKNLKEGKI